MLSDNIRNYRKENNMSQDELAEKLGVSRQSVSLWETGQSQPTIENVVALTKIFNVSADAILGNNAPDLDSGINTPTKNADHTSYTFHDSPKKVPAEKKQNKTRIILIAIIAAAVMIGGLIWFVFSMTHNHTEPQSSQSTGPQSSQSPEPQSSHSAEPQPSQSPEPQSSQSTEPQPSQSPEPQPSQSAEPQPSQSPEPQSSQSAEPQPSQSAEPQPSQNAEPQTLPQSDEKFDIFAYCKEYAIEKGTLNGDFCMYQQPATRYGGYENEYFSVSYWGDSDMVEFCLHCPLSDTYSINFYLRMRGGYDKKYEYLSSRYYRSNGVSVRSAMGYIDPAVFSDNYPLSCDEYLGSAEGQNDFMEESRVGICDLIHCLKNFVEVENLECDFSDFEFVNY